MIVYVCTSGMAVVAVHYGLILCVCVSRFSIARFYVIQWDLFIKDTLGPANSSTV